jgi:hypothetical protein
MELKEYFETTEGSGILATADSDGLVAGSLKEVGQFDSSV